MSLRFPTTSTSVMIILSSLLFSHHTVLIDIITTVKGDPKTTIESIECSVDRWGPSDVYGALVTQMINDLAAQGAGAPDYECFLDYSYGPTDAYGLAACDRGLSQQDCTTCLAQALQNLLTMCPSSLYAEVAMVDCVMKYDDYPFYVYY